MKQLFFTLAVAWLVVSSGLAGPPQIVWSENTSYGLRTVALSADGSRVAAGVYYNVFALSATNGALLRLISVGNNVPTGVALSSNGNLVFAGMGDEQTRLWRISDGALVWGYPGGNKTIYGVDMSTDGLYCANTTDYRINRRSAATGAGYPVGPHEDTSTCVSFSPNSQRIASGSSDFTARVWRTSDGAAMQTMTGHEGGLYSVAFSPDGALLATTSGDGTAKIWNVTNGVCLQTIPSGGDMARFTANGELLVTLTDTVFNLWRVSDGRHVASMEGTGAVRFDIARTGRYFVYGTLNGVVTLAYMPLMLDTITRQGNETVLQWQGGSGLYQVQTNASFATNGWQNLGPATTNTIATNVSTATRFFRVQSLPNP